MKFLERLYSWYHSHRKGWKPNSELIVEFEERVYSPQGTGERGEEKALSSNTRSCFSLPSVPFYTNEHGGHVLSYDDVRLLGIGAMTVPPLSIIRINPDDLRKRIKEIEDEEWEVGK